MKLLPEHLKKPEKKNKTPKYDIETKNVTEGMQIL